MPTLTEALYDFDLSNRANGLAPKTVKWYSEIINKLVSYLGAKTPLQAVTRTDMRSYVALLRSGDISEESARSYIVALKRFWAWCAAEYTIEDPTIGIKRPKKPPPRPRRVKARDVIKMLAAAAPGSIGHRDRALIALAFDTGARCGGLARLKLSDMDLVLNRATVLEKRSKERPIFWSHTAAQFLMRWMAVRPDTCDYLFLNMRIGREGEPLTPGGIGQIFRRLGRTADVRGFHNAHAFRHGFAVEFILNGGDIVTLAKLLGHDDVNITAAYYAIFSVSELAMMQAKYSPLHEAFKRGVF